MVGWPETSGAEAPPAPSVRPPEPRPAEYRSLHAYATVARIALGLVALTSIVSAVFDADQRELLSGPVSTGELQAAEDRQAVLTLAFFLAVLIAAIFFIAWLRRAYANLRALGVESLRFGTGWAVGAWFVPILNLFRPVQIVNDVWRGSHPYLEDRHGWRDARVPQLIGLWWGAWIVSYVVGTVATFMLEDARRGSEVIDSSYGVAIASDLLTAVAALLGLAVVDRLTARQEAAAARAAGPGGPAVPAPRWLLGRRRLAVAGVLCAAAAGLGALIVAVQPASPLALEAAPELPPASEAPETFSYADDFSDPESGWVVDSDEEASYVYEDGEYRMTVTSPEMTWFSLYGMGVGLDPIRVMADAKLASPATDAGAGLGCFATEDAGYFAEVWGDGYFAIAYDLPDTDELALVADGDAAGAIGAPGETMRLGLTCDSGPPTTISLTVDGRMVDTATHNEGLGAFQLAAFSVSAGTDESTVYFDNVSVSRPSGP